MTDFEKIEKLLKSYKQLKSEVGIELNQEYPEYTLNTASFVSTGSKTNVINSIVEQQIVDKYSLSDELTKKIQVVEIIRLAYESLTELQQIMVRERYFENKTYRRIRDKVHLHEETISLRVNEQILPKLKAVGILKAYEIYEEV